MQLFELVIQPTSIQAAFLQGPGDFGMGLFLTGEPGAGDFFIANESNAGAEVVLGIPGSVSTPVGDSPVRFHW